MKELLTELAPKQMEKYFKDFTDQMFFQLVGTIQIIELTEAKIQIYQQGEPADQFYFILEGSVVIENNEQKKSVSN